MSMEVDIKATNIKLTRRIKKAIEEKIAGLDKFIPQFDSPVRAFVEVALESRHHLKGKIFYAEANIELPRKGKVIRATAREENLYQAINVVKDELQRVLKKYKAKQIFEKRRLEV